MGKYLHLFDTESAFNAAYNGSDYLEPWVSYTDEDDFTPHVDYNKSQNWVIIGAAANGSAGHVLSAGTKFVPGSQGAKYTFTWPGETGGPYRETFIVGETMVPEGYYVFDGRWSFLGKYSGLGFQNEASNNCYFVEFDSEEGEFIVSSWCR